MEARLNIITLGVADLERSALFYERLGFVLRAESNDHVKFYALAGVWLALYPRVALAEDANVPSAGEGFRGFTMAQNVRSTEEVDQVIAAAVKAGAELVKSPCYVFWGGYSGYFADPDGFLWEIAYNPHFWPG